MKRARIEMDGEQLEILRSEIGKKIEPGTTITVDLHIESFQLGRDDDHNSVIKFMTGYITPATND